MVMRIIDPARYQKRPYGARKHFRIKLFALVLVIGVLVSSSLLAVPPYLDSIDAKQLPLSTPASQAVSIPWPAYGEEALGATGFDVLATKGPQNKMPTASVAKIITALAVLKAHPLKVGEQGPAITINEDDVASYHEYAAQGGSVVPVNFNEQISEYQALQALLLPSANNMAFTLARWSFNNVPSYVDFANQMLTSLAISNTHIADESGFSASTVSTAHDLVLVGQLALANPVLAEIVAQTKATVPVAGEVKNVNWLLGQDGINGIKTGNTNEAGGCYLFSAPYVGALGQKTTIIGAILGAPDLNTAIRDSRALLAAARASFASTTIVKKGQALGTYTTLWGIKYEAVARDALNLLSWKDVPLTSKITLQPIEVPTAKDAPVGQVSVSAGSATVSVQAVLKTKAEPPNFLWRLKHRFSKD